MPLACHIIGDKSFLYAIRVVRNCLANGIVDIFMPLTQIKSQQIIHAEIRTNLLFSLVEINYRMRNKASMTGAGSSTYTSGTQVGLVDIDIIDGSMILAC